MPKHLLNYPSIQKPVREETYTPSKHEWGTDAATKWAKKLTPGEEVTEDDEVSVVRRNIEREKDDDAKKHNRMLARARLARARRKNREDQSKTESADKSNPVAKHARKFNKSAVMRDRKKDSKRGYTKHKGKLDG